MLITFPKVAEVAGLHHPGQRFGAAKGALTFSVSDPGAFHSPLSSRLLIGNTRPFQLSFERMDPARNRVYALVKRIPKGRVITYGQLARAVRLPGGARAAGRAMAACPRGQAIPWHRVIAAGGRIAIREPFASLQRRLLESEGVRLIERRVALSDHLWAIPRIRKPSQKPKQRPRARK